MSQSDYDVVIVGARCAGATLATYLARGGAKVLLLDQSSLPSDVVLSTHTLHPSGMAVVDELGLGDDVRQVSPEMSIFRLDWQGAVVDLTFEKGRGEYCPRRQRFDGLLQGAAVRAGAELRDCTTVRGLDWSSGPNGDRVAGVMLQDAQGVQSHVSADLVVGADGRNSKVAQWVQAPMYFDYEAPRGMYWSYWPAPDDWGRCIDYPAGMYVHRQDDQVRVAFHTDENRLLIGTLPQKHELEAFRRSPLDALRDALRSHPMLGAIVENSPLEAVRGYRGQRYFFRQGAGKGWLLLGDAGVHKDFLSGDGMSEALIQARGAARDILGAGAGAGPSLDAALNRWWKARDVEAFALFCHAQDLSNPSAQARLDHLVFTHVVRDPLLLRRLRDTFCRGQSPYTVVPPLRVLGWVLQSALRGNPGIVSEFMARGRRSRTVMSELRRLKRTQQRAELHPGAPLTSAELPTGRRAKPQHPRLSPRLW